MGVIDQTTHTVDCTCGKQERITLLQHGSQFGGTWQSGKQMKDSTVTWSAGKFYGPEITAAICKSCGKTATVTVS
jgi:hypothetical protein